MFVVGETRAKNKVGYCVIDVAIRRRRDVRQRDEARTGAYGANVEDPTDPLREVIRELGVPPVKLEGWYVGCVGIEMDKVVAKERIPGFLVSCSRYRSGEQSRT